MLWRLFQLAVFVFVVGTNIQYQWTDNRLVAGLAGFFAAAFSTQILSSLIDFARKVARRIRGT